jgi:hypothetical protein
VQRGRLSLIPQCSHASARAGPVAGSDLPSSPSQYPPSSRRFGSLRTGRSALSLNPLLHHRAALDETDGFDQGGPSVAGPAPVQHVALDGRDLRTRLADHETDVAGLPIGATCLSRPDRSTSLKATHWTLPACQPTSQRRNRLHPRSPPDGTPGVQPRADRCVGRCMHALELVEKPSHHQLAPTSSPNRARDGPARPRSWSAPLSSPDRRLPPAPRPSGSRAGHRDRPLRRRPGRGRLNVGSPRSGGASPVAPALRRPGGRVRCGPRGRVRPLGAHRSQHQRPGMAVKERPVRGAR